MTLGLDIPRAGRAGFIVDEFLAQKMVAIGWLDLGDVTPAADRSDLLAKAARAYPDAKPRARAHAVAQVLRFTSEPNIGDSVLTYSPSDRLYYLGRIESKASFDEKGNDPVVSSSSGSMGVAGGT